MITIFSFASHREDFIPLQLHSFQRHLQEDFEFVILNNALYNPSMYVRHSQINEAARKAGLKVIDIQKDKALLDRCQAQETSCSVLNSGGHYSNANVAHSYALCWAWENIISKEKGNVAIFDSDLFLIEPLKLTDGLNPHVMTRVLDGRPHPDGRTFHYMWPTFMLVDLARLPDPETLNWWCGKIEDVPVDVGGQTYHYFEAHPELDIYTAKQLHSYYLNNEGCDFDPPDYDQLTFKGKTILHYRSGSNWNHRTPQYHEKKTEWLKKRIG